MRRTVLLAFVFASCFASAQLEVNSYSGDFSVNGSPYGGGRVEPGSQARLTSNDSNPFSSISFGQYYQTPGFDTGRTQMQLKTTGSGSFNLPSDRLGGKHSVGSGITEYASTWNRGWFYNDPVHQIDMDVAADMGLEAAIDIDVQRAPDPTASRTMGGFTHDWLDNSIYDLDPTAGNIVIDKFLTPNITMNYMLPGYSFFRDDVRWVDGSTSASAFMDKVTSGMWFNLDGEGEFRIFGSPFSSVENLFNAGEGATNKDIGEYGNSYNFDISTVKLGHYTGKYWAIPWVNYGTDTELGGLAVGSVEQEDLENNITIVPEPGSMVVLLGGIGFFWLRKIRR